MNIKSKISAIIIFTFLLLNNGCESNKTNVLIEKPTGYLIKPVNIQHVKLTDKFWLPIIKRVQEKTIKYAIQKCKEEGRFDNFLIAGGQLEGNVKGSMPFDDSDVYKIIEGGSNSLISAPNKTLDKLLDSLIGIVKIGQEEDGYLTTWRTINPAKPPATWVAVGNGERWSSLDASHELYNAGHLYEAAVIHYKATGKRNFLNIALKNADLMVKTFGDNEGQIKSVPGHQIIETGLIQLYQVTNNEDYLNLSKYFLDNRGNPNHHKLLAGNNPEYLQDHIPVIEQNEVVGHAVRAVYMYAGMTDIAAIKNDSSYLKATKMLWENMVQKKMYITGGIGAKHQGEAFGENYELPNLTAYSETCAAIGSVYWNHRLHQLTGDVKYYDVIERTLYNGLISGLSLSGKEFFYPNALESDGVYKSNRGSCTRQSWFDCSCCPTNVIRFIPSISGLLYSKEHNTVYVNLYASSSADIVLDKNNVTLKQETQYPLNGKITVTVSPERVSEFTIKFRIPGWSRNEVLPSDLYAYSNSLKNNTSIIIDGKELSTEPKDGYYSITRKWKKEEKVILNFPMRVRKVIANKKIVDDRNKVALEYGPLVYAIEEIDNKTSFDAISVSSSDEFIVSHESILGGINTLNNNKLKAIPYYTWSNRGIGKMKVWLTYKEQ